MKRKLSSLFDLLEHIYDVRYVIFGGQRRWFFPKWIVVIARGVPLEKPIPFAGDGGLKPLPEADWRWPDDYQRAEKRPLDGFDDFVPWRHAEHTPVVHVDSTIGN